MTSAYITALFVGSSPRLCSLSTKQYTMVQCQRAHDPRQGTLLLHGDDSSIDGRISPTCDLFRRVITAVSMRFYGNLCCVGKRHSGDTKLPRVVGRASGRAVGLRRFGRLATVRNGAQVSQSVMPASHVIDFRASWFGNNKSNKSASDK